LGTPSDERHHRHRKRRPHRAPRRARQPRPRPPAERRGARDPPPPPPADAPYAPTRTVIVDVLYRSRTTAGLKRGRDLDAAIVEAIVRRPDYGYGWLMGDVPGPGLLVVSSAVYGGLGRIGIDETGTVDELAKYAFETL
jgi:hypothetical protein